MNSSGGSSIDVCMVTIFLDSSQCTRRESRNLANYFKEIKRESQHPFPGLQRKKFAIGHRTDAHSGSDDVLISSPKEEELKSVWFQSSVTIFLPLYIDAI